MQVRFDEAVTTLYRGALETFVAERKRLSAELKAEDPGGAARLSKLARPTVSVWVVNQLWWEARELFDELFEAARRLQSGDLRATAAHREALAKLRTRASEILTGASHATPDALMRRVATTLSALAAAGGFDPDPPGALASDRDPPGFETVGMAALAHEEPTDAAAEAERERAAAERRLEAERAEREAARLRLEKATNAARAELEQELREVERLKRDLAAAERRVSEARRTIEDLEARLNGKPGQPGVSVIS